MTPETEAFIAKQRWAKQQPDLIEFVAAWIEFDGPHPHEVTTCPECGRVAEIPPERVFRGAAQIAWCSDACERARFRPPPNPFPHPQHQQWKREQKRESA